MSTVCAETAALLQELIRIESVNPALSPTGSGEQGVVEFLTRFCRERNLPYEIQPVVEGRSNLLTWVPGQDPDKRVLFIAHMDTVPTGEWKSNPFSGEQREGRIYGRGACDDKGPLAAMLVALSTLGDRRPKATVVVAADIDEEGRKIGARAIAQSGVSYDAAVVGECTNLELVVAHKGSVRWQVEVEGVAAHTSKPHLGVNAITAMAKIVLALDQHGNELALRSDPFVGPPALTVGLIEGGVEITTVPPRCRIWIDRRLIPGESPQLAIQEVEDILESFRQGDDKIKVRSLLPALEDPAPPNAMSSKIAVVAAAACADVVGSGKFIGAPWGTDASQLSLAGIPCIVLGPGSDAQAHTNNEFIEIDQLGKAVEIYQHIMLNY
ncbi:M20 family metallopeptidase [Mesorhizobium humile]|uniref:Probable succinyl-diaminopimelate desuccinylase n=1 Tax=Mesorhizobium humile TaxID=3072313 RepID=A0ABU4YN34_9HYPH|nr:MULTISPECIES: M20 family metallopeptidase [unclassified Mesorhizobium]MDX8463274.1 M20 family metallopeptidase [Mesorhizobium sp. VK2D]MDX8488382.1 M20 family metallopeptidase [Mesorhizobium sp. VK2B]